MAYCVVLEARGRGLRSRSVQSFCFKLTVELGFWI